MKTTARRPVDVTVRIKSDAGDGDFELITTGVPIKRGSSGNDDELVFDNWQGGQYQNGFAIDFTIQDDTGRGYGFFQNPRNPDLNDAMAVKIVNANGHCPRPNAQWDGFVPTDLSQDRQTLTVENPNTHKQYFGFAFHFSLEGETRASLTYDPGGDNRNGQPPLHS